MFDDIVNLSLAYGSTGRFSGELHRGRLIVHHAAPQALDDPTQAIRHALGQPLDFPPLERAFLPEDRIVLVVDPQTPHASRVVAELWRLLAGAGVDPGDVTLLEPFHRWRSAFADPSRRLPIDVRDAITIRRHDPSEADACGYLANTAAGDRIYLARDALDADCLVTIGPAMFDNVLGYRGGSSSLFPGLSDQETLDKTITIAHDELLPDDSRPLRQMADEVAWLIGSQIAINVIPAGQGQGHQVLAGQADQVMNVARKVLREKWYLELDQRAEMAIVTVTAGPQGESWDDVASAIDVARRIVSHEGRIVVLSQIADELPPSLKMLANARTPQESLRPIRKAKAMDLLAATRIAQAADKANIYFLSQMPSGIVEDLFMIPLESEREVDRLLQTDDTTAIIESAQYAFTVCR